MNNIDNLLKDISIRHASKNVEMHRDGAVFYHSGNDGTWMCEAVNSKYIRLLCV